MSWRLSNFSVWCRNGRGGTKVAQSAKNGAGLLAATSRERGKARNRNSLLFLEQGMQKREDPGYRGELGKGAPDSEGKKFSCL